MKRLTVVLKAMVVAGVVFAFASCGGPESLAKDVCKCVKDAGTDDAKLEACHKKYEKKIDEVLKDDKKKTAYTAALTKCME